MSAIWLTAFDRLATCSSVFVILPLPSTTTWLPAPLIAPCSVRNCSITLSIWAFISIFCISIVPLSAAISLSVCDSIMAISLFASIFWISIC